MSKLIRLLEKRRKKLGENQAEFAGRIMDGSRRVCSSFYGQIKNGHRRMPEKYFPKIANLLEISIEEVTTLAGVGKVGEISENWLVSADELRRLAAVVEAAGKPLPLPMLLSVLSELQGCE